METLERTVELPVGAGAAFAWHQREGAIERMLPPWERIRVVAVSGEGVSDGSRATFSATIGRFPVEMTIERCDHRAGERYTDVQIAGPFARWEHVHEAIPRGESRCAWRDRITWELRGEARDAVARSLVRRRLERALAWCHATLRDDLALHAALPQRQLTVAVTGASGLVGSTLCPMLSTGGHRVLRLRRSGGDESLRWDPARGLANPAALEGVNAVVHLAGESIATRWTPERRDAIRRSRVEGTRALVSSLRHLKQKPSTLICASAVGWYPSSDLIVDENTPAGTGFLARLCRDWEDAARDAEGFGARVVNARFGMVLSPKGGGLATMLPAFRAGMGGPLGSGRQWQPYVSVDDAAAAILFALLGHDVRGPVNVVAPDVTRNVEFSRTLARVLHRPCLVRAPAFALRLALGDMADELLLASHWVRPGIVSHAFRHDTLEAALRHVLGREMEAAS